MVYTLTLSEFLRLGKSALVSEFSEEEYWYRVLNDSMSFSSACRKDLCSRLDWAALLMMSSADRTLDNSLLLIIEFLKERHPPSESLTGS